MRIGKFLAVFLSVILFFMLAIIISSVVMGIFPGFHFYDNQIIRIIVLIIIFILTRKFYDYIYGNSKKENNDKVIYGSDHLKGK